MTRPGTTISRATSKAMSTRAVSSCSRSAWPGVRSNSLVSGDLRSARAWRLRRRTAHQIRALLRSTAQMDRCRLGLDAELAIGQELDHLMREGAVVFHDVPGDQFNLDHVVVAPQGVFAIETKGYAKPNREGGRADATLTFDGKRLALPHWSSSGPIEQAERQARCLATWLESATAEAVHVVPILALPGWYVERKGRGEVLVFSGKELRGHLLKARPAKPLGPDQMQRVAHQLEQRCRNVQPEFRPPDE